MSAPHRPAIAGLFGSMLLAGCSTLGGNVGGDFACRAPEGTCAPTTLIDEQATGQATGVATNAPAMPVTAAHTAAAPEAEAMGRTLQIVVTAKRDSAGREHEARVIHVVLPEPAGEDWRQPASTGDLLRAIGAAVTTATPSPDAPQQAAPESSPFFAASGPVVPPLPVWSGKLRCPRGAGSWGTRSSPPPRPGAPFVRRS
ncbi:hypothetical protein [Alteraurantiacibacter buctensis]|uniref:hypothetical protein n=1 Tax=Alteraurantiacibacter buctensis TaxID=1503981 RepID=UPI001925F493|nr:hypothetical protein [Alteraurantiacibacter buctensis]